MPWLHAVKRLMVLRCRPDKAFAPDGGANALSGLQRSTIRRLTAWSQGIAGWRRKRLIRPTAKRHQAFNRMEPWHRRMAAQTPYPAYSEAPSGISLLLAKSCPTSHYLLTFL
ncbi:hypothetical protein TA05_07970 [Citrobacter rodentium]|nr:hypothetical protein TA05_07970 [Citrobacter rodentium]